MSLKVNQYKVRRNERPWVQKKACLWYSIIQQCVRSALIIALTVLHCTCGGFLSRETGYSRTVVMPRFPNDSWVEQEMCTYRFCANWKWTVLVRWTRQKNFCRHGHCCPTKAALAMTLSMEAERARGEQEHDSTSDETDWRKNSSEGCGSRTAASPLCEKRRQEILHRKEVRGREDKKSFSELSQVSLCFLAGFRRQEETSKISKLIILVFNKKSTKFHLEEKLEQFQQEIFKTMHWCYFFFVCELYIIIFSKCHTHWKSVSNNGTVSLPQSTIWFQNTRSFRNWMQVLQTHTHC